nr:DMT family transporter [Rhodoplanes serenus]
MVRIANRRVVVQRSATNPRRSGFRTHVFRPTASDHGGRRFRRHGIRPPPGRDRRSGDRQLGDRPGRHRTERRGAAPGGSDPVRAILSLVFVSLLWGSSFLFIKVAAGGIDPLGIAAGRLVVAACCLLLPAVVRSVAWPRTRAAWGKIVMLSLGGQIFPFLMLGLAGHLTTSVDMALMMGAAPLVTFLIARVVPPGEPWTLRAAAGLGLGFVGVVIALSPPVDVLPGGTDGHLIGRLCALLAAVGYAVGAIVSRNLSREVGATMIVTASMSLSAAVAAASWLALWGASAAAVLETVSTASIVALVVLGVVNTAFAYVVYVRLIHTAGAVFASLNNYLVPVFGLVVGAVALSEPVGPAALAGLALILGGVLLVRVGSGRAR